MLRRTSRSFRSCAVFALLALGGVGTGHATERRPVPATTIYPGDIIRDQMLTDKVFDEGPNSIFVSDRSSIVGKVSRHTLLPDQPIPVNAIGEPRLVTVGSMVRLVYAEGGLTISTYGSAMQAGAAGDVISLRNRESGIVVSGMIQSDGSVLVGGGG